MILSFHPCYVADENIICAGRPPDEKDRLAIVRADAVILPQGCPEALYRMVRKNCAHVFPDYDARFQYPGKTGQAELFQVRSVPHPRTWIFKDLWQFHRIGQKTVTIGFPWVFKLDWGGEGDTVFLVNGPTDLNEVLARTEEYERSGQKGFIVQEYINGSHRTLRVVVIGQIQKAYWRVQKDPFAFGTSIAKGARLDTESDPHLLNRGIKLVNEFCRQTKINLAGFDIIFDKGRYTHNQPRPMLLEINYFFGRSGLGGSEPYYGMLLNQIDRWLVKIGLSYVRPVEKPGEE